MTRLTLAMVVWLGLVGAATAQTPPAFGNFQCGCQPGLPSLVPTPSLLAPTVTSWRGTVYALSTADAQIKAKSACVAENRGSTTICDTCRCLR